MSLIILPYVFLLLSGSFCLVFWKKPKVQRYISIFFNFAVLIAAFLLLLEVIQSGIQVVQLGNWIAPYGISLVADTFSSLMLLTSSILGLGIFIYSGKLISSDHEAHGFYFLSNILLLGVMASFLTGDLFNLFVCFELMLISSFVLMALGRTREQLEGSIKYVVINIFASICFLTAVGLLYGHAGALNMAHLSSLFAQTSYELSLGEKKCDGALVHCFCN
jgi:multicomponent Na+:H+ antiporter subunit D